MYYFFSPLIVESLPLTHKTLIGDYYVRINIQKGLAADIKKWFGRKCSLVDSKPN